MKIFKGGKKFDKEKLRKKRMQEIVTENNRLVEENTVMRQHAQRIAQDLIDSF